jgi:DNA repair exonuclease SbcCD ATPase subunit
MGKTRRSSRDLDDLKALKEKNSRLNQENRQLRREISNLRKQLSQLDIDRRYDVQDLILAHDQELSERQSHKALIAKWSCHQCGRGTLILHILNIPGGSRYYRHCNLCPHRTPLQPYTKDVEGVLESDLR